MLLKAVLSLQVLYFLIPI
uniref:Uncharacterized protein n=1 Tax=Arundo donax TaxID=35708 RepID=A0A0A9BKP3_ARUDO